MSRPKPRPAPPRAPPKRRGSLAVLIGLAACLLLVIVFAVQRLTPQDASVQPPAVDLSTADASVKACIVKLLEQVRAQPRSGQAWGQLGTVLRAYDFPIQASNCLARAEQLEPENPRWPYFQSLLLTVESPGAAIAKLRDAVRLCGSEPEMPRFKLAALLAEAGRWEEAALELGLLLRDKPDFAPARLLLARRAQARGEISPAISLARQCTEDPRTTRAAWHLLSGLFQRQGDAASAAQALRTAAAAPTDASVADPFEFEVSLLRGDPRHISYQAHALLATGCLADAKPMIDLLVQRYPEYPDTWLLVGRFHFLNKQFTQAEAHIRRHLQLDPRSAQGYFQLGMVLMNENRNPDAASAFNTATQLKPDFGPAFYNLGLTLVRSGKAKEAPAAFREAIRHNPERLDSYFLLADLLIQSGDLTEAARYLDQARLLNPDDQRLVRLQDRLKKVSSKSTP